MSTELNFNANNIPPAAALEAIPNGWYRCHIVESEAKPTANGRGKFLEFRFEVLDGEHKGRSLWARLNIVNDSAKAQEIAQRELSAICHATGVLELRNSGQLHHLPLMVKVIITKEDGYEPRNEVKGYKAVEGATPVGTTTAAATVVNEEAPAWARK